MYLFLSFLGEILSNLLFRDFVGRVLLLLVLAVPIITSIVGTAVVRILRVSRSTLSMAAATPFPSLGRIGAGAEIGIGG